MHKFNPAFLIVSSLNPVSQLLNVGVCSRVLQPAWIPTPQTVSSRHVDDTDDRQLCSPAHTELGIARPLTHTWYVIISFMYNMCYVYFCKIKQVHSFLTKQVAACPVILVFLYFPIFFCPVPVFLKEEPKLSLAHLSTCY